MWNIFTLVPTIPAACKANNSPKVQDKNKGMHKLAIHMKDVMSTRIEVRFEL